jgi:hypothetical protein
MGGATSTNSAQVTDAVFTAISRELVTNLQDCETSATVDQSVTISGSGHDVGPIDQDALISFTGNCEQTAESAQEIADNVARSVGQTSSDEKDAAGQFFRGFAPGSDNTTNFQKLDMSTNMERLLTVENISKVVSTLKVNQTVDISGTNHRVKAITQRAALTVVSDVLQKTKAGQKLKSDIIDLVQQDNKIKSSGLFSSGAYVWIVVGIVIVAGVGIYAKFSGGRR